MPALSVTDVDSDTMPSTPFAGGASPSAGMGQMPPISRPTSGPTTSSSPWDVDDRSRMPVQREGRPAHRRRGALTRTEGQRRQAMSRLIAVRERNNEVMSGLETERDRLVARGRPISSPVWREGAAKPTRLEPASRVTGRADILKKPLPSRCAQGHGDKSHTRKGPLETPVRRVQRP
jgi:hypothetical protein